MHVGIDQRRVQFQEQDIGAMAIVVQYVVIGLAHGVRKHFVAHEAAIDEQILRVARTA